MNLVISSGETASAVDAWLTEVEEERNGDIPSEDDEDSDEEESDDEALTKLMHKHGTQENYELYLRNPIAGKWMKQTGLSPSQLWDEKSINKNNLNQNKNKNNRIL